MKVRELQTLLQDYHPDEELGIVTHSNRFMKILGIDKEETRGRGMPILSVDWCYDDSKPVETEREALEREAKRIEEQMEKIDRKEERAAKKKTKKKTTTGKRGRPPKKKA